jgi:hypothetical protein
MSNFGGLEGGREVLPETALFHVRTAFAPRLNSGCVLAVPGPHHRRAVARGHARMGGGLDFLGAALVAVMCRVNLDLREKLSEVGKG